MALGMIPAKQLGKGGEGIALPCLGLGSFSKLPQCRRCKTWYLWI